ERVAEYQQIKAFGRTTFVHPDFGTHLLAADAAARPAIEAHEGHPFTDADWQVHGISGFQPGKPSGLHPWGVAIDLDYLANPYVAHEGGEKPTADRDTQP